ncbi:MAG: NAD-dependent epimerase/dehydratase family protein [Elusimicrobia bacterium]|nr:NAD-dependent epimerase/dehydratase family protein [Elusimicrobiota bacterium]
MRHPVLAEDLEDVASRSLPFRRLAGASVLVTGAAGFLPAYMVETLLWLNETRRLGIKVLALERDAAKARRRFAPFRGRRDLRVIAGDVCEPVAGRLAPDFIVHAASPATPAVYRSRPAGTLLPNVVGAWRMLELARRGRAKRILFFSSSEVYGRVPRSWGPVDESRWGPVDPMGERSCYAEGKRAGEALCAAWRREHGVPAVVVRPFHTYGPGMPLGDGRSFSDLVAGALNGRELVLRSDGRAVRSFCYAADAVAGFFTVLLKGEPGQAYNVGQDRAAASVLDFARLLVRLFPERRLRVVRRPGGAVPAGAPDRITPDLGKLRALGWRPRRDLADGLRRTVAFFS